MSLGVKRFRFFFPIRGELGPSNSDCECTFFEIISDDRCASHCCNLLPVEIKFAAPRAPRTSSVLFVFVKFVATRAGKIAGAAPGENKSCASSDCAFVSSLAATKGGKPGNFRECEGRSAFSKPCSDTVVFGAVRILRRMSNGEPAVGGEWNPTADGKGKGLEERRWPLMYSQESLTDGWCPWDGHDASSNPWKFLDWNGRKYGVRNSRSYAVDRHITFPSVMVASIAIHESLVAESVKLSRLRWTPGTCTREGGSDGGCIVAAPCGRRRRAQSVRCHGTAAPKCHVVAVVTHVDTRGCQASERDGDGRFPTVGSDRRFSECHRRPLTVPYGA